MASIASVDAAASSVGQPTVNAPAQIGDWRRCDSGDPNAAIAGCSAILLAGQGTSVERAVAALNRAIAYDAKGEVDRAIADYDLAVRLQPDFGEGLYRRGNDYIRRAEYDRAIADFDAALKLAPNDQTALLKRGETYVRKGAYDRAIADYNAAIERNPRYADAYNDRGVAYFRKADYDHAIADATQAIALKPDFADAFANRAESYERKQDYNRAIADYSRALAMTPKSPELLEGRGLAYFALGDYDGAIADYTDTLGFMPDAGASYNFASTFRNRGRAYLKKGQRDRAMADFNEATRLDPKFAAGYYSRGTAFLEAGQNDRATDDLDRALRLDPNYPDAYFNRAIAEGRAGRYASSIADLDRYIRTIPDDANAYYYRGDDYRGLGQNDRAVVDYSEALRLRPNDEGTYIVRAASYIELRDYDRALQDCETAIRLASKDGDAFQCRGAVYDAQRQYDRAQEDFQRAVAIEPDLFNGWMALGKVHDAQGDFDAAVDAYSHAIAIDPKSARAFNLRGFDQYQLHRDAPAMVDFNRAVQINPRYGGAFESRGFVYLREANYRAAIREFTIALQLEPSVIVHYARGASYFFMGEYRRAMSDFAAATWRQVGDKPAGKALFAVVLLAASALIGRRVHRSMSLPSLSAFYRHMAAPAGIAWQRAALFARAAGLPLAISAGFAAAHGPLDSGWDALWGALDVPEILVPASASALVFGLCLQAFAVRAHQIAGVPGGPPAGFWTAFGWFNLYALALFGVGYGGVAVGYATLFSARANGWLSNLHLFGVSGVELVFIGVALGCSLAVSLVARCSLMLPAAACGHPLSLNGAWRLGGRAPWQLNLTVAFYIAIAAAVSWIGARAVASAPPGLLPPDGRAFANALVAQLSIYFATALVASTLSLFYREQRGALADVAGPARVAATDRLADEI